MAGVNYVRLLLLCIWTSYGLVNSDDSAEIDAIIEIKSDKELFEILNKCNYDYFPKCLIKFKFE